MTDNEKAIEVLLNNLSLILPESFIPKIEVDIEDIDDTLTEQKEKMLKFLFYIEYNNTRINVCRFEHLFNVDEDEEDQKDKYYTEAVKRLLLNLFMTKTEAKYNIYSLESIINTKLEH